MIKNECNKFRALGEEDPRPLHAAGGEGRSLILKIESADQKVKKTIFYGREFDAFDRLFSKINSLVTKLCFLFILFLLESNASTYETRYGNSLA